MALSSGKTSSRDVLARTLDDLIDNGTPDELASAILSLSGAYQACHPKRVRLVGPLSPPCVVRAAPYNSAIIIKVS